MIITPSLLTAGGGVADKQARGTIINGCIRTLKYLDVRCVDSLLFISWKTFILVHEVEC